MLGAHLVLSLLCTFHTIQPLCVCRSAKPQASAACKVLCFKAHTAGTCVCLRVPGTVKRSLWHGIKECASLLPWGRTGAGNPA